MRTESDDALAVSVFALALDHGFVRREDVVRWADRRIAETDIPPAWLIDLSLSQDRHLSDLISELSEVGTDVSAEAVLRAVLALVPGVRAMSFDEAETLAKRLYGIARHRIDDWGSKLLGEADAIDDEFALVRSGYCSRQAAVERLADFVADNRDERAPEVLRPVVWSPPLPTGAAAGSGQVQGPVIHVGLSSWIIQDGNYGDFAVGQEAEFALEFHSPKGLRAVEHGPHVAEHLGASRYRVRGPVIFAGPKVWVIATDTFMAFQEKPLPEHVRVGSWVEGEVYLGIDPFFYFEHLHRLDGMPPLAFFRVAKVACNA